MTMPSCYTMPLPAAFDGLSMAEILGLTSPLPATPKEPSITVINSFGDILLTIITEHTGSAKFRVSSHQLMEGSVFFRLLLDPGSHFSEGLGFQEHRRAATNDPFPIQTTIEDPGSLEACEIILRLFHGKDVEPPVGRWEFIFEVAVVADYWDAGKEISGWAHWTMADLKYRDANREERPWLDKFIYCAWALKNDEVFKSLTQYAIQIGGVRAIGDGDNDDYFEFITLNDHDEPQGGFNPPSAFSFSYTPTKVIDAMKEAFFSYGRGIYITIFDLRRRYESEGHIGERGFFFCKLGNLAHLDCNKCWSCNYIATGMLSCAVVVSEIPSEEKGWDSEHPWSLIMLLDGIAKISTQGSGCLRGIDNVANRDDICNPLSDVEYKLREMITGCGENELAVDGLNLEDFI